MSFPFKLKRYTICHNLSLNLQNVIYMIDGFINNKLCDFNSIVKIYMIIDGLKEGPQGASLPGVKFPSKLN